MDDEDNDDNTHQRGQTIIILKPRLSPRVAWAFGSYILANNCKGDILQLEEDILRQIMMTLKDQCVVSVLLTWICIWKAKLLK